MTNPDTYVALLYSVVLGAGRRVVMEDLRHMAEAAGLLEPRTVLATGNLVFSASGTSASELEQLLEKTFETQFGRRLDIIVRQEDEWKDLFAANPFPQETLRDPSHVVVRVQRAKPAQGLAESLSSYLATHEKITIVGKDIWIYFAQDIGHSRLAASLTPKRAGIGTMRNWNTVCKVGNLLGLNCTS